MSQVILNVHAVLQVLTAINESNTRDFPNTTFRFSDVRESLLSFLIYSNALTNNQILCPEELVSRLDWLRTAFHSLSNVNVPLYELTEDEPEPKAIA